ncbi:hypothetical protein SKAU_G00112170 [Synaphobranchus kaupii]|uniref:Sfi1 spindle body domain-containing protein n=1 Tax=Synaphobranchus kaupii TaxID=118154 RepID=A0A9Q1G1D3_SYNKA|nr:hypothetical protein SKAU_G00112170 [Synaphobranchus kaupii]
MDWNPEKRLREKCPSRPESRLVNRGPLLEGGSLHPPRENVDELLELLSSLSEDLPSSVTSPVSERSRNVHRSGSFLRQRNLTSQMELTPPKSGHALPAWEGKSIREHHSETKSTKTRTVRFADFEPYPTTPGLPCDSDTQRVQMDSEKPDVGGYWQMEREYSTPGSTAQLESCKAPQKSQSILTGDTEFDSPLSQPFSKPHKQQAYFNRDRTDSHSVDCTGHLCEDEAESVSELHSLLESSWTSASLHRSMLDLEISEQLLTFELGPLSPKARGDFSHLDKLESAAENSSDMSASYNANKLGSFSQCQQRENSCHAGRIDSRAGTPVISQENRVTNQWNHSDIVINSRLSSQLVRPHSARTLNSSRVPIALSQDESDSGSKHQTCGTEDTFSVCGTASDPHLDKHRSTSKALSQHRFSSGETSTEGRFSKDCATLSRLIREDSRLDEEESCAHSAGNRNVIPPLAVYHMTGSTEVPRFLLWKESLATKENLVKDVREVTKGEVRHSRLRMCRQECGDGHATFVEESLGRRNGKTRVPHAPSGAFSHMDQRGVAQPSSTACAFKERAFCDSDGNPWDKRKEAVPGGMGSAAPHQSWRPPDAMEAWSSGSVATEEERFLARCRLGPLSRCLRTWSHRRRCQAAARCQHRRRALKKGLSALRWAVTMRRMQTDAVATRRRAARLSRCFRRWKAVFEQKRSSAVRPSLVSDANVEALRRRLIQPSDSLVLRTAYCAWRRHFQGLQLLRAAHIHYHLTLLFKHWLEWRRLKMVREARVQLEQQAQLQRDGRLTRQALLSWRSAWDKACRAQTHHRLCSLATVWRRWAERVRSARERLRRERWSEGFHKRALLQPILCRWIARTQQRRSSRDRQQRVARMAALRWKATVKRRRLVGLGCKADQRLAQRTLSAALRKWCQEKSSAAVERRQVQEARHLLARRRLRAAFISWRCGSGASRIAWAHLERVQKTQLFHCLWSWRRVVHQRSVWARYLSMRQGLSLRRCLGRWRQALELRHLYVAFITRIFQRRRQRAQGRRRELRWGVELWGESEPIASPQCRAHRDLLLYLAFYTWKDCARNLQLARVHHVTKAHTLVRVALQHWHRLAQQALGVRVLSFSARLAQLDPAPSLGSDSTSPVRLFLEAPDRYQQALTVSERCSGREEPLRSRADPVCLSSELGGCAPRSSSWQTEQGRPLLASPPPGARTAGEQGEHVDLTQPDTVSCLLDQSGPTHNGSRRLKCVAVSALGRIRHGPVAAAFCQWRALVRTSRGQRALLDCVGEVTTRAVLRWAFRIWRTGRLNRAAADRHRERSLLGSCVTRWSGAVCHQRGKAISQRAAEHFHTHGLLTRCFSTWRKRGRVKVFPEPEDAALLERRVVWLLRRAEKHRLRCGFTLWAARVRQNLAVRLYRHRAVLTRVFVAWEMWAWLDQERRVLVLQQVRGRLCRAVLDRWRIRMHQQQEIQRKRAKRLSLQAREILQRWSSYVQNKSGLCQLLCEHVERKRMMMKRRALRIWAEGTERLRRADVSVQKSLKIRYLLQWHSSALCGARARRGVDALKKEGSYRVLRSAFFLWRERWQHREQRLLGRVRTAACRWRQRALLSRAETRHAARLTSRALLLWRDAQARRGERRRRARQSSSRQEEALAFQERSQRSGLAERFRRWAVVYRMSLASAAFHARQQHRRVLLAWHRLTVATLACEGTGARFRAGCQERLTASCFSQWHGALLQARCRLLLLDQRFSRQHQRVTLAVMQRWKTATRGRVMQRHLNEAQLQKLFGCWKEKTEVIKAADVLCAERGRRGARSMLRMWLRWAKETKARRQMGEAVWLWVRGRRVSSTFYLWVRLSRDNKEASQLSCTHLLHRCLCEWQLAVNTQRQALRAAEERACSLQIYASFTAWRKHVLSQHALRINIQQARARQEKRLLSASLRAWHRQVEAHKCRSLCLSKKYLCLWVQAVFIKRSWTQSELEDVVKSRLGQKYLRRWRQRALERSFTRRRVQLLWASWRSQAAVAILFRRMVSFQCAHRLQERAWLTWRKRRIRTRVSTAFAAHRSRALLAQAFGVWRDRSL